MQETLDTALNRIQALEAAQQASTAAQQATQDENERMRRLLEERPRSQSPQVNSKEPKVASPESFHGKIKAKLEHYLLGINLVINTQRSRFPDDITKINYAISYLRDDAMAWVQPFASKPFDQQPAFLKNFNLFVQELKNIFGDPDEVATAERNIRKLRQRGSASSYFAEFRRISAVLNWNDSALASQAYTGLRENVKDELARVGRPNSLEDLILIATRIDNRLHERAIERNTYSTDTARPSTFEPSRPQTTTTTTTTSPSTRTIATIKKEHVTTTDASRPPPRGPLTQAEKDHRRQHDLCLYCGSPDHKLADCPKAPAPKPRTESNRATTTSTASSEN